MKFIYQKLRVSKIFIMMWMAFMKDDHKTLHACMYALACTSQYKPLLDFLNDTPPQREART